MDLRKNERDKINNRIRDLQQFIKINKNTIVQYKKTNGSDYSELQIEKLLKTNSDYEIEITNNKNRLVKLERGEFDDELSNTSKLLSNSIDKKDTDAKKKRLEKQQLVTPSTTKKYISENSGKNDATKFLSIYDKVNASIPDYMSKNLQSMPSNKGYIWRGCWCFGQLPAEKNKNVYMFEKKNEVTIIHEISDTDYKIFHKIGEKKILKEHTFRSRK